MIQVLGGMKEPTPGTVHPACLRLPRQLKMDGDIRMPELDIHSHSHSCDRYLCVMGYGMSVHATLPFPFIMLLATSSCNEERKLTRNPFQLKHAWLHRQLQFLHSVTFPKASDRLNFVEYLSSPMFHWPRLRYHFFPFIFFSFFFFVYESRVFQTINHLRTWYANGLVLSYCSLWNTYFLSFQLCLHEF